MSEDLANFVCRRCGACCRLKGGIVRLSDAEIARIAAFLGVSEADFIRDETEVSPDRTGLVLKDRDAEGTCGMLGDDGLCRIHAVKPDQCRTFPSGWRNAGDVDYCAGLRAIRG